MPYTVCDDFSGHNFRCARTALMNAPVALALKMKASPYTTLPLASKDLKGWDHIQIDSHAIGSEVRDKIEGDDRFTFIAEFKPVTANYTKLADFYSAWKSGGFRPYVSWANAQGYRRYLLEAPRVADDDDFLKLTIHSSPVGSRLGDPIVNGGEVGVILDGTILQGNPLRLLWILVAGLVGAAIGALAVLAR